MNSKQAHPFTSLSLSITMTTNSRALPRPALQRRPELRARGADAVGQLVQPGGAGVWVRRQRGRKGWGQKRDFFFSFSLKKKKSITTTTTTITTSPQKRPGPLHRGQPRVLDLSQPRGGLFPGGRRRRRVRAGVRSPAAAAQALGAAVLLVRVVVLSFSESRRPLFQPRHSVRSPSYCILRACTMPFFLLGKSASRASNNAKTLDLHYNYHDKKNTKIQNPKSHQVLDHQGSGAVHPAQLGAECRARIDAEGLAAVDAGGRGSEQDALADRFYPPVNSFSFLPPPPPKKNASSTRGRKPPARTPSSPPLSSPTFSLSQLRRTHPLQKKPLPKPKQKKTLLSPLYSDFAQGSEFEKAANLTRALEPIFFENSVDLVLTGHIHNWQRSCPAAKGGCVAAGVQAPVHVATPSAGK